jgi:glucose/arabinose dehydrogenase
MPAPPAIRQRTLFVGAAAILALGSVAGRWLSSSDVFEPRRPARVAAPVVELAPVASGFGAITAITNAGDERLFVTIQTGQVRILSGGQMLPTAFLDVSDLISVGSERGLLSTAFHPSYAENGFFFVYYTNDGGDIEIARLQRSASDPNQADPTSRVVVLTIPHPGASNHNGGQLQFGPDGYLYIGTGDGGSANDPPCNAQRDEVLLGKLLRIDVDQNVNSPPFYGVPADNPFATPGGPRDEIWAKGLRNPWRFSFDRLTGDLWIGDVGQGSREEIDFQPRASTGGENYGWKMMEGTNCANGSASGCPSGVPACNAPGLVLPRYQYSHGEGCSVTGGFIYRGALVPALAGRYVYGDYCSGRLWADGEQLEPQAQGLSTFGEDVAGEIYVGTQDGRIQRFLDPNAPQQTATPTVTLTPSVTPERVPVIPPPRRLITPRVIDRQR